MRKSILLALVCTLVGVLGCSRQTSEPVFHDMKGNAVQLSHQKGKWVIVNYWAEWCHTCRYEVPELNNFVKHNQDHDVVFYGVDFDPLTKEDLQSAIDHVEIDFPVLSDDPRYAWQLGDVIVLPTTFIINPEGRVVEKIEGASSEESLRHHLALLKLSAT